MAIEINKLIGSRIGYKRWLTTSHNALDNAINNYNETDDPGLVEGYMDQYNARYDKYISNEDLINNTHSDWDAARVDKDFDQITDSFIKFSFIVKGFRREFDKAQETAAH